jgi:hypothetical protein
VAASHEAEPLAADEAGLCWPSSRRLTPPAQARPPSPSRFQLEPPRDDRGKASAAPRERGSPPAPTRRTLSALRNCVWLATGRLLQRSLPRPGLTRAANESHHLHSLVPDGVTPSGIVCLSRTYGPGAGRASSGGAERLLT